MRPLLCGLAAGVFACYAQAALAQQGSLQISTAAQGITGDEQRLGGQNPFEPDAAVSWIQPTPRLGTLRVDFGGTRRADRLHAGRTYVSLRDLKLAGMSWTIEAGDTYTTRAIGEYRFTNLMTPTLTFNGGAIAGRGPRGAVTIMGGRATAWRNIFGSDPDALAQTIAAARGELAVNSRIDVLARASRIQTSNLREFSFTIADSRQAGGGVRLKPVPAVQLVADASLVQYRRVDSPRHERDGSYLLGANVLISRGWLQVNAVRFSPGEFPAMNDPLHDREAVFAAGEYDLTSRVRMFGGWEAFRTNLDPEGAAGTPRELPRSEGTRGFGGVRVQLGSSSTFTLRAEDGDAVARPIRGGFGSESDTGVLSGELQSAFGRSVTMYTRASRRENVTRSNFGTAQTQHDLAAQFFVRLSPATQLFGLGAMTRHETLSGGNSYWQAGGGAQLQIGRDLWVRGEATTSRNVDLITNDFVPRESLNVGMSGRLSRATFFSFHVAAGRSPLLFSTGTPWTTRSMLRLTQTFSTGAARVPTTAASPFMAAARARGTGTIVGSVYADWNANGTQEGDEGPLQNIPVRIVAMSAVTTGRDGEFSFLNVPVGRQKVGLDTSAVPVDFDPPSESTIEIELDRGITRRLSFGLIPLGSVRGRVVRDANGNGLVDPGEEPLDDVVLVLDGGARSEQVRRGRYSFEAVRSGSHVLTLLPESLPEGARVIGVTEVPIALTRDQLSAQVDFAVVVEKRPENRRVFPSRIGAVPPSTRQPSTGRPSSTAAASGKTAGGVVVVPVPPLPRPRVTRTSPAGTGRQFAVQIAALGDPLRARALVRELTADGYAAYLVPPGAADPDGPYKVRIGRYATRAAAEEAAAALERLRGEKLWVIRDVARR